MQIDLSGVRHYTSSMNRRKPKAERKADVIQLRVTSQQKQALSEKAKRRGLSLSSWLLTLGISAPEQPMPQEAR
jgi:uncharacterized protein (DUF1778 family)